jgi:Spy/CpxP family protein refolding chaperone
MSTVTKTVLKRVGLGLAIVGLAAGAGAFAADDAGSPAAPDTSAQTSQGDQPDQGTSPAPPGPSRRGGPGHFGPGGGYGGPGPGGHYQHRGMMGRRDFHRRMMGRGRSMALRMDLHLLAAVHQLKLTSAQRDQVRTVVFDAMQTARRQRFEAGLQAEQSAREDSAALSNPGDPNYGRAVQQLKSRAVERVQQSIQLATDTEQKLYNVLTADQKAQLPKVLSDMAARRQQRMAMRMRPHRAAPDGQPEQPPQQ